ncbi:hypothetical protein RHGRI_011414 [Rhododendron griersonianum]|uniref:Uncharacterized protein n=1 Tax=Rhododendron griersonianum TaxID=479676 RepID=A0AAV6KLY8_9ERIC|nr:hypothetical protein RHGRI_011414 [Rhododendron griersonianum]
MLRSLFRQCEGLNLGRGNRGQTELQKSSVGNGLQWGGSRLMWMGWVDVPNKGKAAGMGEPMPGSPVWEGGSQPGIELSKEGTSVSFLQRIDTRKIDIDLATMSSFICMLLPICYASGKSDAINSVLSTQRAQGLEDSSLARQLLQRKNKRKGTKETKTTMGGLFSRSRKSFTSIGTLQSIADSGERSIKGKKSCVFHLSNSS